MDNKSINEGFADIMLQIQYARDLIHDAEAKVKKLEEQIQAIQSQQPEAKTAENKPVV